MNDLPAQVIEKFWKHVEKTDSCWNWTGTLSKSKSPNIRFWNPWKEYSARRVSLQIAGKNILNSDRVQPLVCHNSLCVNPNHLVCGDEERFWHNVQKLSEEHGGCWVWLGEITKDNYGRHSIHDNWKIIHYRASHYSWKLYTGRDAPKGILLCHTCDHPYCVNPQHLFLGTPKDNNLDMMLKERSRSPFTAEDVRNIRAMALTMQHKDIAIYYGKTASCITGIVNRKRHAHVI